MDALNNEWVSMERHRLDVVGEWPPSPLKEATLMAIRSTLASLTETCSLEVRPQRLSLYR